MIKRWLTASFLVVLSASAALAGIKRSVVYQVNGAYSPAGGFYQFQPDGTYVYGNFYPSPLPDGSLGYYVGYEYCDIINNCSYVDGLVPSTAITVQGPTVSIKVIPDVFVQTFSSSGSPADFIGTFKAYTGPNSERSSFTGTNSSSSKNPDGSITTYTLNGTGTSQTANFIGVLGPETVAAPQTGSNGWIVLQTGTMKQVITTP
jgi:hypothetical protein